MYIHLVHLGRMPYAEGLRAMNEVVAARKAGHIGDTLLLLEHPPVLTLGRNATRANILATDDLLAHRGVEIHEINRGGDVTYHGPGQLVGYPIFDLRGLPADNARRKTLGAIEYVRRLEDVLIRTCADFRIAAGRIAGLTGVWTLPANADAVRTVSKLPIEPRNHPYIKEQNIKERDLKEQAKIAAIGVHISRGVTSHGFALNVNTDLSFFDLIVPCGITNKPVTSMEKELGSAVSLADVAHAVARTFGAVFHSQVLWLETLEALLDEKVGVPARPPEELRRLHHEDDTRWA